ncbi:glycosyltransferase 87 family protein [Corynebacterium pseudopelargi]|uniref:Polyprenol-phosphate-mannose-dependent alpha-(1-2)-phosphatidylinositol mannoside mannosyltransferase n=1 Tax=Corynebacterium pseudopelargi TaxID=2080757 RepID=A0A3G6IW68_9CORY|nr:glycosyltransferase 87 family protein [Corynebacterium pseudopelargi]AZA08908.1 Polyprenol-phosphate-mannose-dependent alpha-(1-2)-phosphatidylinositol mannoside mannosyltransferase [Corynebacterium pseudopelargi]
MTHTPTPQRTLPELARIVSHPFVVTVAVLIACAWMVMWNLSNTLYAVPFGTLSVDEWFRYHIDFDVYREGAKAYLAGENLYTRDYSVWGINLPFTYPPLAAIVFSPFVLVPVNTGATVLNVITALLLWHVLVMVSRRLLPTWTPGQVRGLATVVLPLMLVLEPLRETMSFSQVNVVLMWLVVLDIVPKHKRLPRGILVGFAAAIKLTPAVFGLYFLVNRQWRAAITSVLSAIVLSAIAWILAPASSSTYWFSTLRDPERIGNLAWPSNQSIRGVLARAGVESSALWLLLVLLSIALIAYAMWKVSMRGDDAAVVYAVVANSAVALLCSPVSWTHHWVWVAPALLALSYAAIEHSSWLLGAFTVLWTATALHAPHWNLPRDGDAERTWSLVQQFYGNAYVELAVIAILLMCVYAVRSKPAGLAASSNAAS